MVNPAIILSYFMEDFVESNTESDVGYVKDYWYYFGVLLGLSGAFLSVLINYLISDMVKFIHPIQSSFYSMYAKAAMSSVTL